MGTTFIKVMLKLTLAVLLSSAVALTATRGHAHELQPTVADLTVADGVLTLDFRLNLEALMADIDLDAVSDTDEAENVADYDALRAMDAPAIADKATGLLDRWNGIPMLTADGQPVALMSAQAPEIPEDVDIELARISTWTLQADLPAGTRKIAISWPDGGGEMVLRQQNVEAPYTGFLGGGDTSPQITLEGGDELTALQAFVSQIIPGFEHILPKGLDHILFVLGLFFFSTKAGPLLWQVSVFTLAHTVTLALGALGVINAPGEIVEPLIAASIVYVAVENIYSRGFGQLRLLVVFGFGLLHGLGFASVFGDLGLPEGQFIARLVGFNLGVEIGQLTVIAMAALLIWLAVAAARVARLDGLEEEVREYPVMFRAVSLTGSLAIGIIGAYWVVERTLL